MNESPLLDDEDLNPTDAAGPRRPPFMFAKRHGVLVAGEEDGKVLVMHTAKIEPGAIVELRRFMGRPLKLKHVDEEQFNGLLAATYEQGSNEAMQMMEDLGDDMDLFQIATPARNRRPAGKRG